MMLCVEATVLQYYSINHSVLCSLHNYWLRLQKLYGISKYLHTDKQITRFLKITLSSNDTPQMKLLTWWSCCQTAWRSATGGCSWGSRCGSSWTGCRSAARMGTPSHTPPPCRYCTLSPGSAAPQTPAPCPSQTPSYTPAEDEHKMNFMIILQLQLRQKLQNT